MQKSLLVKKLNNNVGLFYSKHILINPILILTCSHFYCSLVKTSFTKR